eukprot:9611489-Ditylum_brightwellii.AAC.2
MRGSSVLTFCWNQLGSLQSALPKTLGTILLIAEAKFELSDENADADELESKDSLIFEQNSVLTSKIISLLRLKFTNSGGGGLLARQSLILK